MGSGFIIDFEKTVKQLAGLLQRSRARVDVGLGPTDNFAIGVSSVPAPVCDFYHSFGPAFGANLDGRY